MAEIRIAGPILKIKTLWRVTARPLATSGGPGWTLGSPTRSGPRRVCGGALPFLTKTDDTGMSDVQ